MEKVIDFAQAKLDREAHAAGEAVCLACQHEWVAVSPLGIPWLECPNCHCHKGTYKHPFYVPNKPVFHCNCGNHLLVVYREFTMCPACGSYVEPWNA